MAKIIKNYTAIGAGIVWRENENTTATQGTSNTLSSDEDLIFTGNTLVSTSSNNRDVTFSAPNIKMESFIEIWNDEKNSITFKDTVVNFDGAFWSSDPDYNGKIIFSGDSKLNLTSESNKLLIICNDVSGTITLDLDESFVSGSTFSIQANSANNLIINNAEGYEVIPTTDGTTTTYTVNRVALPEVKEFVLTDGKVYKVKDETARNGLKDKQDVISDLYTIREGARFGATAVQPYELNDYATKEELNGKQDVIPDLSAIRTGASKGETAVQPNELPTKTSELENDSGFITIASLSGYATQDWVQGLGYITGINASDVTTALGYTPLKQSDLSTYATKSELSSGLNTKQDTLEAGENITIEGNVISATGGGGGGDVDVLGAIDGQTITPYEVSLFNEWSGLSRNQSIHIGGDHAISLHDYLETPDGENTKDFGIGFSERDLEFYLTSNNDRYASYLRFTSERIYIDFTGSNGVTRNLTISLRYGTVYYADSERGDFEFDLYDVMNALNTMING